jgi:hypothetical protein
VRLYIYKITKHEETQKPDTYDFTKSIDGAWHWLTREPADLACSYLSEGGITIEVPYSLGNNAPCTEFRVEQRPQGGFAISCEHPFASE